MIEQECKPETIRAILKETGYCDICHEKLFVSNHAVFPVVTTMDKPYIAFRIRDQQRVWHPFQVCRNKECFAALYKKIAPNIGTKYTLDMQMTEINSADQLNGQQIMIQTPQDMWKYKHEDLY